MTPSETALLSYLLHKGVASDSQIQDQLHVTSGSLMVMMRSLKRKLFVEQDGRYYRATKAGGEALQARLVPQPFAGQPAW